MNMYKREGLKTTIKKATTERVVWRRSFPNCGIITIGSKMGDGTNMIVFL